MRLGTRVPAGFVALSLLATACGSEGSDPAGGGVYYPTGSTGSSGTTGATGPSGAEADVQVSLNNYLFDPNPIEVTSGDVVAVRNGNTKTPHTFTVVGQDVDLELGPLETETVRITLEPGTYDLVCRFHEALDMTGTLVVS